MRPVGPGNTYCMHKRRHGKGKEGHTVAKKNARPKQRQTKANRNWAAELSHSLGSLNKIKRTFIYRVTTASRPLQGARAREGRYEKGMKQLHYIQLQIHFCTICLPWCCCCCCFWAQIWKARAPTHTDIDTERDTETERKKKHCCIPHGAPLLILWLASNGVPGLQPCTVRLAAHCLNAGAKNKKNEPCSCHAPSRPLDHHSTLPACKLCKYLFKNFTLKCICGWVPSVAAMLLLPECRKKRTKRIEKVEGGGEHPSSCERISKAASQCPKLLLSAAFRPNKCEQTVEISKALPTFRCINKFEDAQVLQVSLDRKQFQRKDDDDKKLWEHELKSLSKLYIHNIFIFIFINIYIYITI